MSQADHPDDPADDQRPVEVQEALEVSDDSAETPPAEPKDQPPLPDFNP